MDTFKNKLIHEHLLKARKPLFVADKRIDGDALGSSLALVDYLAEKGKNVSVIVSGSIPEKYKYLPHIENCTSDRSILNDPEIDLVVTFDCSEAEYIKEIVSAIPGKPMVINIDHHATNPNFGDINLIDAHSPATAEMIYRFFQANGITPSKASATSMLCGIAFDTTIFTNDGTDSKALEAASDLALYGARVQDVIRMMFWNRSIAALRIWGLALERLRLHPELGFVATCLTRQDILDNGVTDDEIDGLSDFLNIVTESDTLFVIREALDGSVKASMRTSSQNVAAIAAAFGGGGHVKAAGFSIPNSQLICGNDGYWRVEDRV